MLYTIRRLRLWTVEVRRDKIGGHNYAAWIGASADRPLRPRVCGWAEGGRRDALAEAQMDIDRLDGRPEFFGQLPKLFHH